MNNSVNVTSLPPRQQESQPHGLPPWVYRHPELMKIEIERILRPSWQIVCHISQIKKTGDFVTFELGTDSVVVLREPGGGIRAFHNVCRHRGTRLLEGSGTCPGRIVCPYHGWTYRYDGSLLATPARDTFPNLNLREHGLAPVRVETMLGFVFVCLAGDPPPPSQVRIFVTLTAMPLHAPAPSTPPPREEREAGPSRVSRGAPRGAASIETSVQSSIPKSERKNRFQCVVALSSRGHVRSALSFCLIFRQAQNTGLILSFAVMVVGVVGRFDPTSGYDDVDVD